MRPRYSKAPRALDGPTAQVALDPETLTRKKGQVFDHLGEIVSPAFGENQVQSLTSHVRDGNPKSEAHEHVKSKELIEVGEKIETLKRRVLVAPTTESKTPEKDMSRSVIMGAKDEDHVELDIDRFKQVLVERDNNSGWTMETKLFQEKVVVSSLDTHERLATIEKVVIESNWPDADGEKETLLDTLEHVVYHDDLSITSMTFVLPTTCKLDRSRASRAGGTSTKLHCLLW